jgi:N-acyl-D-amino-acid deacylase
MFKFDLCIRNARIIDGTGTPWYRGDIGITGGKITYIGNLKETEFTANKIIDANDKIVSPGIIDCHTHFDYYVLGYPELNIKARQGVTTILTGACGISIAPLSHDKVSALDTYAGFIKAGVNPNYTWGSVSEYLNELENLELGINVGTFVGHGTIRLNAMGFENRKPTNAEMDAMKNDLKEALEDGAFGLTSGLIYPPGIYSAEDEIIELAGVLKEYHSVYLSHMRNESTGVIDSVQEIINVAKKADVPVQIHHHKVLGTKNWGLINETLKMIDDARKNGLDVTLDQYPYTAASTTLRACLPGWVHEGGVEKMLSRLQDPVLREKIKKEILEDESWENWYLFSNGNAAGVVILYAPHTPIYEGKTLAEASKLMGKEPVDALLDIILDNKGDDNGCYFTISEDDIIKIMQHPVTMIGSDSIPSAPNTKSHPRNNGTFTRVLSRYVRDLKALPLEEAIRKMTGYPATRFGIHNKGFIKINMDADLLIFDENQISDRATFEEPGNMPVGIEYVIVNGEIAVKNGEQTEMRAGTVIRKR